ncbi:hypothetical protein IAQ61_003166 [Plenodomus lingam]|uniref:uncharacterized protein n=1 Tax=Leptosphaeria maculans TaxID=5022 RepID=UPI003322CE78|nr:hypothetical protein IAQ61_003166 [Plenodomus lingam]
MSSTEQRSFLEQLDHHKDPADKDSDSGERRVIFEAFETSATSEHVLASPAALLWDFPGCAVSVPWTIFSIGSFQEALAIFLEQASTERVSKFAAVTRKASAMIPEIRNTSDPALISGLLMTILEGHGTAESVPVLRKRVRDSVLFDDARKPWRRSAFYLAIRVAVQRYLYRQLGPIIGRVYYKVFICILLEELLEDALHRVSPEIAHHLRQKLGRRLAKLESDASSSDSTTKITYSNLMRALKGNFEATLRSTGALLKNRWQSYLQSREPMLPTLRLRAYDTEFHLCLRNSGSKLRSMRVSSVNVSRDQTISPLTLLLAYEETLVTAKPYMQALLLHMKTYEHLERVVVPAKRSAAPFGLLRRVELGEVIHDILTKISATDADYPNQRSQMLLHMMELWIILDKVMVTAYPLLEEYHPGFDPDILDPIQLFTATDMQRAQDVRAYLTKRYRSRSGTVSKTIFDDPADDCFAVQYYDRFDMGSELSAMREEIEEITATLHAAKLEEWNFKSQCHEKLIEQRNEARCIYDAFNTWDGGQEYRHRKPCAWHDLNAEAKNMSIQIFEDPLPNYEPAVKAVLFEILCPEDFAAYRDATWKILSMLCFESIDSPDRVSLVREYSQLRSYTNNTECKITLGSYKKAHLESHYATSGFPIRLDDVLRTCGLRPRYYDTLGNVWTGSHGKASLWHHFPLNLPAESPYQRLNLSYRDWPSSNTIQANQVNCPEGLSVHEFAAWQGLFVGVHSRWPDLLRELGSTNLNFSSTSTCVLVLRLVSQQGPASTCGDGYTDVHDALLDETLCTKLFDQIRYRLEAIQRNWREPVQMNLLITILLRVVALTQSEVIRKVGEDLLAYARQITNNWRAELHSIVTEDPKLYQSAIWASLLCKQTMHTQSPSLSPGSLRQFIDASIALQYNLTGAFRSMPQQVRSLLVQDIIFSYEMRHELKQAILTNTQTLVDAIDALWQIPKDHQVSTRHVAGTWWILVEVASENYHNKHYLHYNYLHGNLLINGKEMGTLPLEIRAHKHYHRLFGHRNPTVFPSHLQGMSFTLSDTHKNGHRVHFGFRKGELVIRVFYRNRLLEYVPYEAFGEDDESLDLPKPLIEGCFHWIDVHNGNVQGRCSDPWVSRPGDWWLIWHPSGHYRAIRRLGKAGEVTLLEPLSDMAQSIARIFHYFEQASHIVVHASTQRAGEVVAELKRLELIFNINRDGLLESQRLGEIVMKNQDAGTWYGLKSKIVIQSKVNRRQKSILIPMGPIKVMKDQYHVAVEIEMTSGTYLKFGLNETLGRVECPPEPKLLYTKALFHAYTSHFVPDRLTGRTGTEEALYLLQTGCYRPWQPLKDQEIATLLRLAKLSPQRGYYPRDLKCMETVVWKPELTVYMQDDRYRALVLRILRRSSHLSEFYGDQQRSQQIDLPPSNLHLAGRSLSLSNISKSNIGNDERYFSRDSRTSGLRRSNIITLIMQLLSWQVLPSEETTLSSLLHNAHFVGGYDKYFRKPLLTDQIGVDIKAEWGALTRKALDCGSEDRFGLIFLFSAMAFSEDANLALIRMLICFAIIPDLRGLDLPKHPGYHHFRLDGAPPVSYLVSLLKMRMPFMETGFRNHSQLLTAQATHESEIERICAPLAKSILRQWPNTSINRAELDFGDSNQIVMVKAIEDIEPEWERLTRNHELGLYFEKVQEIIWRHAAKSPNDNGLSELKLTTDVEPEPGIRFPMRDKRDDDMLLSDLLRNTMCHQRSSAMLSTPVLPAGSHSSALATRAINIPVHFTGPLNVQQSQPTCHTTRNFKSSKTTKTCSPEIKKLRSIAAELKNSTSFIQCRYAKELETSITALEQHLVSSNDQNHIVHPRVGPYEIRVAKDRVWTIANSVRDSLQALYPQAHWLQLVDLWPKTTIVELLSQLRSTSGTNFGNGTKEVLVELGVAITQLQRFLRLQDAQKRGIVQQEQAEWTNDGHTNWEALEFPDWLLIEIDGNHLLRKEQVQVALATMNPDSGQNSVLQLLMGKGKTSCILRKYMERS